MKLKKLLVFVVFNALAVICRTTPVDANAGGATGNMSIMGQETQIPEDGMLLALNFCYDSSGGSSSVY